VPRCLPVSLEFSAALLQISNCTSRDLLLHARCRDREQTGPERDGKETERDVYISGDSWSLVEIENRGREKERERERDDRSLRNLVNVDVSSWPYSQSPGDAKQPGI